VTAPTASSSSIAYRPELDGIRALGILLVIAQHINLPNTTLAGLVGVNLFFVLSGYLITSILLKEHAATGRISLRRFYERRVRRLVPALVAVLVATGVLMAAQGHLMGYIGPAFVSLFYVSDIAKAAGYDLGYVGHTWSLAMEEQFYVLWPAILLFLPRRFLAPAVVAGIVTSIVLQITIVGWQDNVLAHFRPDVRADSILWGCLIAILQLRVPRRVAVAGLIGVFAVTFSGLWPYSIALSSFASAVVVAGAASLKPLLAWRPLVRIGEISYGLYLWHAIPAGIFMERTLAGDVVAMVTVVVVTFALALISERWIERPFRKPRATPSQTPVPQPSSAFV
jgi:peptidoglycan/LPS O-acetylase OafA/YrhL